FGLMVKLDSNIHGLAHISELSNKAISDLSELKSMFVIGEDHEFEIINIEPAEHRLGLRLAGVKPKKQEKKTEEKVEENKEVVVETPSTEVLEVKEEATE
ncbi:hypothetical protein KKG82_04545, partial [Patescibacteria group bacterium]|nr:hypothetical protein [Patescibacteria group bacterium]